ncbi:28077_t:CDS:2, partial [Gigaspora margarita]
SENNSDISSNEMFEQNTIDEEKAKDIIDKLNKFKQKKKLKRPLVYVENSKMAIGSAHITDLFDAHNNSNQKDKSSKKSSLNNECFQILESEESDLDDERCQDAEINEFQNDKNIIQLKVLKI